MGTTITPGFEALVFKASRGIVDIYELTYIRKDGSRFPAVVSVTALRDAQDAIIGYLLIGADNTARKLYLEEAQKNQAQWQELTNEHVLELYDNAARLSAILNTVMDGVITMDGLGIIETFNPAAEQIFGYAATEIIGHNIKMLMPEPYHS